MVTEKWWPVVTGNKNPNIPVARVLRRPFEICVLTEVMQDLRSGELPACPASLNFRLALDALEHIEAPVVDRAMLEKLLGMHRRAAIRLMHPDAA